MDTLPRLSRNAPDDHAPAASPPRPIAIGLLVALVALAAWLRVTRLADLPAGFFCDEAGLGYSAYSILKTGRDETGALLPLFFWSFDVSYKNPVFIYSAVPLVALFGLNEFAVRLTAALYGAGTVAAMFFLGRALLGTWVGLLAALLLAVCPWHLHFSRIAFELITFPFFFVLAATGCIRFLRGERGLSAAGVCAGLCLYTYAAAKLFVPLFLLGFTLLAAKPLLRRRREAVRAGLLLLLVAAPVAVFDVRHGDLAGMYFRENTFLDAAVPVGDLARRFAANYAAFFSPDFLFRAGDSLVVRHAVPGHGELYPLFAPLLVAGVWAAVRRRDPALRVALWWLAAYPVAAALMHEIPSASRGIVGAPAFCLLAAVGGWTLVHAVRRLAIRPAFAAVLPVVVAIVGLGLLGADTARYWARYADEYPRYSAKSYTGFQFGHRQVVDYFRAHRDDYDLLALQAYLNNQPQAFLLFYDAFPPAILQTEGLGVLHARTKMTFGDPDELDFYQSQPRVLFAVTNDQISLFADFTIRETITAPDGSVAYQLVDVRALKDFVHTWWLSDSFPAAEPLPVPTFDPDTPGEDDPAVRGWARYTPARAVMHLGQVLPPAGDDRCAWAVVFVNSDREQLVRVLTGFHERGGVWVNEARVALHQRPIEAVADTAAGVTRLRAGRNVVAVQSCSADWEWRFTFRLSDTAGRPLTDVSWRP